MPAPRKLHDQFFKKAKAEGYLARSAYKLLEIQERRRLIRPGGRVLDLGCAPGSWLQVAEKLVGPSGAVVGIDLSEVTHRFGPRVRVVQGDAFTASPDELLALADSIDAPAVPRPPAAGVPSPPPQSSVSPPLRLFDVLLSDMAPNTSGHGDDLLSARLCRRVLEVAHAALKPGGHLVMKILEGSDYPGVLKETQELFREARGFKPKASREVSREMFIVAMGKQ